MSHHHHSPTPRSLHKDWRLWIAVALMLVAILTYVFTLDDSVIPVVTTDKPLPTPTAPAQP
jgi:hypothetical protein